jgi:hypothetical protein
LSIINSNKKEENRKMKKMLILLSAVLLFAGGCCSNCKAEDLVNYVPANMDGLVMVDAERLVNLSHLQDLRKDNKDFNDSWLKFESELQKYGLQPSDLPSKLMIFFKVEPGTQNAGVLAITNKITEAKLVELLKANKEKVSYITKTIAKREAYVITHNDKKKDKVVITYLKANLVLICDEEKAEQFFKVVGKAKNVKLIAANKKANQKALVNILYAKEPKAAPAPATPGMPPNPMEKISSAVIALDLVGKTQKDINLKADLDCVDAPSASQMAMQLNMVIMMMNMQLAQDPALSKSVKEAIKIDQKDKNIKINISVSESLLKKIQTFTEARKQQALASRKAAPAPVAAPVPAPVKAKK